MKGNAYRTVEQPHVRWMSERRGANFKVRSIPCGSDARFPRSRNISRVIGSENLADAPIAPERNLDEPQTEIQQALVAIDVRRACAIDGLIGPGGAGDNSADQFDVDKLAR